MNRKTTLIATDLENDDVFVWTITHNAKVDAWPSIVKAFKEYAKTPDGKKYIENNGTNCGDALFTPKKFLVKHGIHDIESANDRVIVNHNDPLLD